LECKITALGTEYKGQINVTISGIQCQKWNTDYPHPTNFKELVGDQKNYCRNPDNEPEGPWCYTMNPTIRWAYCDVQYCVFTTPTTLTNTETTEKMSTIDQTLSTDLQTTTDMIFITELKTTVVVKPHQCFCPCGIKKLSEEELYTVIKELEKKLKVDKKTTSAYIRRHTSARDDRKSSSTIGTIGIVVVCLPVVLMTLSDCIGFFSRKYR
ncbi:receptor tyrosine kinase-like orphan receptor 1, partial [Mytilus galloprovincialis]